MIRKTVDGKLRRMIGGVAKIEEEEEEKGRVERKARVRGGGAEGMRGERRVIGMRGIAGRQKKVAGGSEEECGDNVL